MKTNQKKKRKSRKKVLKKKYIYKKKELRGEHKNVNKNVPLLNQIFHIMNKKDICLNCKKIQENNCSSERRNKRKIKNEQK